MRLLASPRLLEIFTTDRALEIAKSIQALLEDYDRLTRPVLQFSADVSRRSFNLSAPEFAERLILPPLLKKLRKEAPNLRVVVHAPMQDRALDMLERGELDLRIAWLIPAALVLGVKTPTGRTNAVDRHGDGSGSYPLVDVRW